MFRISMKCFQWKRWLIQFTHKTDVQGPRWTLYVGRIHEAEVGLALYMYVLKCVTYVVVPDDKENKHDAKSIK
jgi:hypothetical protein